MPFSSRKFHQANSRDKISKWRRDELKGKYGNYHNYYARRHIGDISDVFEKDARCQAIREEWIRDKVCLDIGCNEGIIDIALSSTYFSREMVGVDVDKELCEKAEKNLETKVKKLKNKLKICFQEDLDRRLKALEKVTFRNFNILYMELEAKSYDTLLCLSTVKWIHLGYGDDGVKQVFAKVSRALKPGGVFVLEYQKKQSYKNASKKKELKRFFESGDLLDHTTLMSPEEFPAMLLNDYGFTHLKTEDPSKGSTSFQNRSVWAFVKSS